MVPKVQGPDQVAFVHHLLTQLEAELGMTKRIGLELQIESARGAENLPAIADASDRIETIIFGPGDYAADLGIPQLSVGGIDDVYPGDQWHYILSRIVITARARGLQAIDGPYSAIPDVEGFRTVAERSARLGCDGKWALHPTQIEILNEVYRPSQAQYDRAEALLAAYHLATTEGERRGAVMWEGEMIDEASRKMAEQVAARGRAAGMAQRRLGPLRHDARGEGRRTRSTPPRRPRRGPARRPRAARCATGTRRSAPARAAGRAGRAPGRCQRSGRQLPNYSTSSSSAATTR